MKTSLPDDDARGATNAAEQREYYASPARKYGRMGPGATPYVERHLNAALDALALAPGARILELGAGMGRFSLPTAARGYRLVASDLSAPLLTELRRFDSTGSVEVVEADAATIDQAVDGLFDGVTGFFFLHHLAELDAVFAACARVLRPGGVAAFCEPSALYLPFYLQIAATPGMSFRGERGLTSMRTAPLAAAARRAGLEVLATRRYGIFPPALANRPLGRGIERLLEAASPAWAPLRAFQVFAARRPAA
jgi:2-polyprenyl-3-methyl-5-hydroxy-6-metoxy-1,4-benzoquinol methylase